MRTGYLAAILLSLASLTANADPTCNAGMLRGLYAYQGQGAKLVSGTEKTLSVSGIINVKQFSVELSILQSTIGAQSNFQKFQGNLSLGVGVKAFPNAATPEQINCNGLITLTKTSAGTPLGSSYVLRLIVRDGGNAFFLSNASTDDIWTATAEKI